MSVGQVVEIDLVDEKATRRLEGEEAVAPAAETTQAPVAEASTEPAPAEPAATTPAADQKSTNTTATTPKISAGMNLGNEAPVT